MDTLPNFNPDTGTQQRYVEGAGQVLSDLQQQQVMGMMMIMNDIEKLHM